MKRSRMTAWLLVVLLLGQLFVPDLALRAQEDADPDAQGAVTMEDADRQTLESHKKVLEMEEVSLSGIQKFWIGVGSKLDGKKLSYYKDRIEEANRQIRAAKDNSQKAIREMRIRRQQHQTAVGSHTGLKSSLGATANAKAEMQRAMMNTGIGLQDVAKYLSVVGTLLTGAGLILSCCGIAIGPLVSTIGGNIGHISKGIDAMGVKLYEAGKRGTTSDQDFFKAMASGAGAGLLSYGTSKATDFVLSHGAAALAQKGGVDVAMPIKGQLGGEYTHALPGQLTFEDVKNATTRTWSAIGVSQTVAGWAGNAAASGKGASRPSTGSYDPGSWYQNTGGNAVPPRVTSPPLPTPSPAPASSWQTPKPVVDPSASYDASAGFLGGENDVPDTVTSPGPVVTPTPRPVDDRPVFTNPRR